MVAFELAVAEALSVGLLPDWIILIDDPETSVKMG